jgi:ankyrin repeat protein
VAVYVYGAMASSSTAPVEMESDEGVELERTQLSSREELERQRDVTYGISWTGDEATISARVVFILQRVAGQPNDLFWRVWGEILGSALREGSIVGVRELITHGLDPNLTREEAVGTWHIILRNLVLEQREVWSIDLFQYVLAEVEKRFQVFDLRGLVSDTVSRPASAYTAAVLKALLESNLFLLPEDHWWLDEVIRLGSIDRGSDPAMAAEHITLLLDAKCDVNASMLTRAIDNVSLSCCRVLLDRKADVNQRDDENCDALLNAISIAAYEMRDFARTHKDEEPSEEALERRKQRGDGLVAVVRLLVEHKANPNYINHFYDDYDEYLNHNALLIASRDGLTECARVLLEAKANPNIEYRRLSERDDHGYRPLEYACSRGSGEIVNLLLQHKADVNVKGQCGLRPLHHACNKSTFFEAMGVVEKNNVDCVRYLLQAKAELRVVSEDDSETPLQKASGLPTADCLRLLVEAGIGLEDINHVPSWGMGQGALHCAASEGGVDCLRYLVELGGDVHARDVYGQTPLHCAARSWWLPSERKLESCSFLLNCKADIHSKDADGQTPLFMKATPKYSKGSGDVFKLLLECKADITTTDRTGRNALHLAARYTRCADLTHQMIACGMDMDLASTEKSTARRDGMRVQLTGTTPIMEALTSYNAVKGVSLRVLLEAKANVNVLCSEGYNAVAYTTAFLHTYLGGGLRGRNKIDIRPRVVFELLCFGMDPEGYPNVSATRNDLEPLRVEVDRIMRQGRHDWRIVHAKVDAFHERLLRVLEDEVVVDARGGAGGRPGSRGIYHEPLEATLGYVGLAHKPRVLNEALDGDTHPAGRSVLRHSVGAAQFWFDRFGPKQCSRCGDTTAPKLRKCPCGSVVYCSTKCQKADWKPYQHKRDHQKLIADANKKKEAEDTSGKEEEQREESDSEAEEDGQTFHTTVRALLCE